MNLHIKTEACNWHGGRKGEKWIEFRFGSNMSPSEHAWTWLYGLIYDRSRDDESDPMYCNEVWISMLFDDYLNHPMYQRGDSVNHKRASKTMFTKIYRKWRKMNFGYKWCMFNDLVRRKKIIKTYALCACTHRIYTELDFNKGDYGPREPPSILY